MALIRCRECGKKISEFCGVCPKCGCPVERRLNEAVKETANRPNTGPVSETQKAEPTYIKKRNQHIIFAVILVVVGVCLFAAVFSQSDEIEASVLFEWYSDALENGTVDDTVVEYMEGLDDPQGTFDPDGFLEYQREKLSWEIFKRCAPFYIGGIGCFAISGYLLISLKKLKCDQTQDLDNDPS